MKADLILKNIGKLVTMQGSSSFRVKEEMNKINIIENAYIAVKNGKILAIGVGDEFGNLCGDDTKIHDAEGLLVTPGLIDSHTHLIHGGSRENEFSMKLNGVPYIEILNNGGGILSTVKATKEASEEELYKKAKKSLDRMLEFGVTTVEEKSGYGLELNTEIKQLEVARVLDKNHPVDLVHTFLGAHAVPEEYKENHKAYIDILVDVMMPKKDGFTLAQEVRAANAEIPIIFLTAKTLKEDILEGFKIGADDYITKPFSMEELTFRIEAILRRVRGKKNKESNIYKIGKFTFDTQKQILATAEKQTKLTTKESELLGLLCAHANEILQRDFALKTIWIDDNYFNARSMDVYITKLRKHLKEDDSIEIINIHGKGYKLITPEAES